MMMSPADLKELLLHLSAMASPVRAVLSATVILGVAGLFTVLAWRASASARHAIWLLAISATLVTALIAVTGPVIELETETLVNGPGVVFGPGQLTPGTVAVAPTATITRALPPAPRPSVVRAAFAYLPYAVIGAWLLGALAVVFRCIAGHRSVAPIVERGRSLPRGYEPLIERAARHATARDDVLVKLSDEIDAPFTVGVRHPVVMLPAESMGWDRERLRIVLVHELAHVARRDYAAQLIATAACAIYWFNPVVWIAAARMRAEAEQAADDRVLAAGIDGVTYATHLLELARPDSAHVSAAVAVGMARSNRLERRFKAMLDTTRSRGIVPPRLQALAGAGVMLLAVPLTGFRMIPRPAPAITATATTISGLSEAPALRSEKQVPRSSRNDKGAMTATLAAAPYANTADTVIERTLAASAGERISIDLRTGGEIVVRPWDQPQVRMRATLSGDQSRETQLDFQRVSGGLELRATTDRWRSNTRNSNRIELWVPRRFDIDVSSAGGGVSISGIQGRFTGRTGGGEIIISDVRGEANITTGGGEVHVSNSTLDGRISTGGGEATVIGVTGNVSVTSGSGPVIRSGQSAQSIGVGGVTTTIGGGQTTVIGGRSYSGAFTLSRAGGEIDVADVPNGGQLTTGGGDVRIGSSGGQLSVTTGGGNIEIARMAGDVSATTGAGDVQITVVNADGSRHNVDVRSGSGRVVIDLPADIDARLDLETAWTERHGPTNIRSDFAVDVTESTDWDSRNGTPRRYVRGVGVAGAGRGLIRIRTVNGDVVIRRR